MTLVVSNGALVPVGRKGWPLAGIERQRRASSSKSLELIGLDSAAAYAQIYASQPAIFSLVNKLDRGVARLPLKAYTRDGEDGRERMARTEALPTLLSRPYPRGSRFRLVEATVGSLAVYGHALWWKFRPRAGRAPTELWPIDWRGITLELGRDEPIAFYRYRALGGERIMLPDEVVHFTWWSPAGPTGTSPLEPLRTTLSLEDAGRRYAVASFANGVRPSGALVAPQKLNPKQKTELRAEIETTHSMPDNAFRMMLLDGGLDWKAFAHTAQEAQTIEHRKLNAIEACQVYDVPPPMLHILDHATFSNIDEQHRMLYEDTFGPWAASIEETIEAQLLWGELELGAAAGAYVEVDMDAVLRASIDKRASAYRQMETTYSMNDRRRLENLPPIDDPLADAVLVPLNMRPVGEGVEFDPAAAAGAAASAEPARLADEVAQLRLELARK